MSDYVGDHLCRCGKWGMHGVMTPDGYRWFCGEHKSEGKVQMASAIEPEPQAALDLGLAKNVDRRASFERYLKGGFDWETKFMAFIRFMVEPGEECLSEVWRVRAERWLGPPPDDHVVGAVVRRAAREGLIVQTGRYLAPRDKKSNASKKGEWRRTTTI